MRFKRDGSLESAVKAVHSKGTTVTFKEIFCNLPVRAAELRRSIRREYSKTLRVIQAYGLIHVDIRFSLFNTRNHLADAKSVLNLSTDSLVGRFCEVFGSEYREKLIPFHFTVHTEENGDIEIRGLISRVDARQAARPGPDAHFLYINKRIVKIQKLSKVVNDVYSAQIPGKYPALVLNVEAPPCSYDVNVTPDKTGVIFSEEDSIVAEVKKQLEHFFANNEQALSICEPRHQDKQSLISGVREPRQPLQAALDPKRALETTRGSIIADDKVVEAGSCELLGTSLGSTITPQTNDSTSGSETLFRKVWPVTYSPAAEDSHSPFEKHSYLRERFNASISNYRGDLLHSRNTIVDTKNFLEILGASLSSHIGAPTSEGLNVLLCPITGDDSEHKARLSALIKKTDFEEIDVIGQFNLGFIIARLRGDLFIVDQHASDEKHTYENLEKNVVFRTQRLLKPIEVQLTPQQELTVAENAQFLDKMGFKLSISHRSRGGISAQLLTLPLYMDTKFDVSGISQILAYRHLFTVVL